MDLHVSPYTDSGFTILVEGITEVGIEFVEAYTGPILTVIDRDRIVIPTESGPEFKKAAQAAGLTINLVRP